MFDDKDLLSLPVYRDKKDRTGMRVVLDRIGADSCKTAIRKTETNEGEVITRYRTRNGMPEAVVDVKPRGVSDDVGLKRGYISDLVNTALIAADKKVTRLLKRVAALWRSAGSPAVFGPYKVAKVPTGEKDISVAKEGGNVYVVATDGSVAVWKLDDELALSNSVPVVLPAIDGVGAVSPRIKLRYPKPSVGDDGWHYFDVGDASLQYRSGAATGPVAELYNTTELFAGTAGYPSSDQAGPTIVLGSGVDVGYTALHISPVGNMLQRSRHVVLSRHNPHATLSDYVSESIQGFIYTYPNGTPSPSTFPGTWLNEIHPIDTVIAPTYSKVGNPLGALPNAAYQFSGYLVGTPQVEAAASSSSRTIYHGSDGLSYSKNLGWFGVPLTAAITVSVTADYTYEDSTGRSQLVTPTTVADAMSGSIYFPPSWSYQWGPPVNYGTLPAGNAYAPACATGSIQRHIWSTHTVASCIVDGVEICHIDFANSMDRKQWTGTQMKLKPGPYALDGVAANLVNPNDNQYYAAYNAMNWCCLSMVLDNIHPVDITTMEPTSGNEQNSSWTFTATTIDYILFDREADTFVYLKGAINASKTASAVTLSLVVKWNGALYEQVLRNYSSGTYLFSIPLEDAYMESEYFPAPTPFAGFAPPFCSQGQFPYGAYSEPHEAGDPTFLMSLPLVLQRPVLTPPSVPETGWFFKPRLFNGVMGYASLGLQIDFWNPLDNQIHVVNFADGVFRDWVTEVHGASMTSVANTFSKVYRI